MGFSTTSQLRFCVRRKVNSDFIFALDSAFTVTIVLLNIFWVIGGRCSAVDLAMLKCQVSLKGGDL